MSAMKVFEFASEYNDAEGEEPVAGKFMLQGKEFSVRYLHDTNVAYLIAAINDTSDPMRVVTKVIDFMHRALIDVDGPIFEKVVLNPKKPVKIEHLLEVFQHVLSLAAAERPTGGSSGSSEPSPKTGTASSGRPRRAAAAAAR